MLTYNVGIDFWKVIFYLHSDLETSIQIAKEASQWWCKGITCPLPRNANTTRIVEDTYNVDEVD